MCKRDYSKRENRRNYSSEVYETRQVVGRLAVGSGKVSRVLRSGESQSCPPAFSFARSPCFTLCASRSGPCLILDLAHVR